MAPYTWPQGQTHVALPFTLPSPLVGGGAIDLSAVTASAITAKMRRMDVPDAFWLSAGSATIVSPPTNGAITWTFAAADVATSGTYQLVFAVNFGAGNTYESPPQVFIVTPAL